MRNMHETKRGTSEKIWLEGNAFSTFCPTKCRWRLAPNHATAWHNATNTILILEPVLAVLGVFPQPVHRESHMKNPVQQNGHRTKVLYKYIQSISRMISNKSPVSQQKTLFIQKKWRLSPIFTTTCGTTKPRNLAGNVLAPKTRDIWRKHHAHEHNGGFRTPPTARTLGNNWNNHPIHKEIQIVKTLQTSKKKNNPRNQVQWTGTFGRCVASSMFLISRFCSRDQMSSNALDNSCSQKERQHVGGSWWFMSFMSHVPTPRRNNFKAQGLDNKVQINGRFTSGLSISGTKKDINLFVLRSFESNWSAFMSYDFTCQERQIMWGAGTLIIFIS